MSQIALAVSSPMPPSRWSTTPACLSGARLSMALFIIGWSEAHAAEKCRMHRTQLRRCIAGTSHLPADLSGWILRLEAAHLDNPPPRQRRDDPALQDVSDPRKQHA